MRRTGVLIFALFMLMVLLLPSLPACRPVAAADSYTAVVPGTLQSDSTQTASVALFSGDRPTKGRVELSLFKGTTRIASASRSIDGKGSIQLEVPAVEEGEYNIQIKGDNFKDEAKVRIENNFLVFLETDKPIYKPGQTIQMRVFTLNSELRPLSENVTVEVLDAKGIKIFRSPVNTDEYGMAELALPISSEPNLGVWKITAVTAKGKTQLDVRVEEYVLPKYEVKVELPREWFMIDEAIKGKVIAEYSFGKPVKGTLEIKASKYVGKWQEYATFNKEIDGEAEFTIPAAQYVAGVPAAGGQGNVSLDISVVEKSTGYQEKTTKLLTVTQSRVNIQIIPSGPVFKPGLPFTFLVVTQTPDNQFVDAEVEVQTSYLVPDSTDIKEDRKTVNTSKGKALVEITPKENTARLMIECSVPGVSSVSKVIEGGYSPSGNFIHVEQESEGTPALGEEIIFKVYSTSEARNFYYEVISRGKMVFTDFAHDNRITFKTTPAMAPSSRLLVYQILPNSEVAADYIPFGVEADYPHSVKAEFSQPEARPGDELKVNVETDGEARVGIAAVDRSVFILAENRLNLQQVFDELEKLYMKPQVELHEFNLYTPINTRGADEIFKDAGVVILTNKTVPEGKEYQPSSKLRRELMAVPAPAAAPAPAPAPAPAAPAAVKETPSGLAEVQRVRQYFPETWLWQTLDTGSNGKGSLDVEVPDSITTWMLRAVALSKQAGLGVAESQLKVFQPFFVSVDLPYSAIRGEEFPVKVAVYNYLNEPQSVFLQIQKEAWFELLDSAEKTIDIAAGDIGGAEFRIRPTGLGDNSVKITARSKQAADAIIKKLLIEPEGVSRELVENIQLTTGMSRELDTSIPPEAVPDSGRVYLAVTSSYLTQTIEGLEALLKMPMGCGEQNMILFAPDVYITKYLRDSGQLKPEIMAKAEMLMITGYQRELTYRRSDGSFSAFGQNDKEGSLWLTAFVMKCFSQAKDVIYIDDTVLDQAKSWIIKFQNPDGSFEPVGFVHHREMLGGVTGKIPLTAYIAAALIQAGEKIASARAIGYLESNLGDISDPYIMALTAYALEMGQSGRKAEAYRKLMELAIEDENGLHWGGQVGEPEPLQPSSPRSIRPNVPQTLDIEATAYATLALIRHGDSLNASRAARWLTTRRNANGGFGSTQDTVVALEALTEQGKGVRADVNLTVSLELDGKSKEIKITPDNFDVLQVVEIPADAVARINVSGKGEAVGQVVRRFNLPEAEKVEEILKVDVDYDVTDVAVNDLVKVSAQVTFNPPVPGEAGMVVLDISVPTGFAPVRDSITAAIGKQPKIKRYEVAGRKVIFYIENMLPGESIAFSFSVMAQYPVKAKAVTSQVYSYYNPEIKGETLSREITVR
jgi:CD109 antigen